MLIKRKEFSNKEQKRLRRKYDLEQGMKAHHSNFPDDFLGVRSEEAAAESKSQAKRLGKAQTNELLEKGEKNSTSRKGLLGKERILKGQSRQELKEIKQAENLLKAGREASRREVDYPTISVEGKKENLNTRINNAEKGGVLKGNKYSWREKEELKKKVEERKARLAQKAEEELKSPKKGLSKNAKIGIGVAAGTAAVGAGVYAYKKHKNKKEDKE